MATESVGKRLERELYARLAPGFQRADPHDRAFDLVNTSGTIGLQLKVSLQGVRDLHAALLELAFALSERPSLTHAMLVARCLRMTTRRLETEWGRVQATLAPAVAARMALVAIADDGAIARPHTPETLRLLELATELFRKRAPVESPALAPGWDPKRLEVWKTLVDAYLLHQPPLAIQDLILRSGVSYPTVASTLERLRTEGALQRTRSRRASFTALPARSLSELLVLAPDLRGSRGYIDASGRSPDPNDLLRRLQRMTPQNVLLGGVPAARHYVPSFDLNGLPRVDVTVDADSELEWLRQLNPALQPAGERAPMLMIHRTHRPMPRGALQYAGPAETLLDLYSLRLDAQARDFAAALSEKGADRVAP